MAGEWRLVGRDRELLRLRELIDGRDQRGAVLAAPAGVGKTRLAVECLARAENAGLATARVTATRSASALPFGALAPLLPAFDAHEPDETSDRISLLRRSATALVERAQGSRLALLVDDAHLLDDVSAALVHQLAATHAAFVLATVRTGEAAPDPVTALWKDGLAERVELQGLPAEAIDELLACVLGGPVDPATVAQLAARSEGNALFLRELVLGALDDGTLRADSGIWRLVGSLSPSDRLMELIDARLGKLTPQERALLELVAIGDTVGSGELASAADVSLAADLERRELLSRHMSGHRLEIRLAHPLYGDVLRARVPAVVLRKLTRALADCVESLGARRREDILRVGTWRLTGGGARPEPMLSAAVTARWRYDFPLAERLARAAAGAGAGFDAALLAAQLAVLLGRGLQAEQELQALSAAATNDLGRAMVAITRVTNFAYYLGRPDDALRVGREAEPTVADQTWRDELTIKLAGIATWAHGPRVGIAAIDPLLHRIGGAVPASAHLVASSALARLGCFDAAIDASFRALAGPPALTEALHWYPWSNLVIRSDALAYAGRLHEAEALADAQYREGIADRSPEAQAAFAAVLCRRAAERGHLRTAVRYGREAMALFRELGRGPYASLVLLHIALAHALSGRSDDAAAALEEHGSFGVQPAWTMVDLGNARAWTAIAAGNLSRAYELLDQAADVGESIGDLVGATNALHSLARIGRAKRVSDRLAALAAEVEGVLARARSNHAAALVNRDPAALEAGSREFEKMGADLLAAEAAVDAAVAWRRRGHPRAAAAAEGRAMILAERCEGAQTPALQPTEVRARMTPAERETALLAAAGRSSKEIADELFLSVRTVENRLQHVYTKLGITRRADLAAALHADHPDPTDRSAGS